MEQVYIQDFSKYFTLALQEDYAEGVRGIQERITQINALLLYLNSQVLTLHKECGKQSDSMPHLDNMVAVISTILEDSKENVLIDFKFVEKYLKLTKDRLEFLFSSMIGISQHQHSRKHQRIIEEAKQVIQEKMTPLVVEIQNRAQLSLPILLYLTQTIQKYCEPTEALLAQLQVATTKPPASDIEERFNTKFRKTLLDEISSMVAFAKRLEFQIRMQIQMPMQMFQLLGQVGKKKARNLLNEDLKGEDLRRIEKMTQLFNQMSEECNQGTELFVIQVNIAEFFQVVQLLEQQKNLVAAHKKNLPLVRENVEPTYVMENINEFKDYVEKCKKIHQKLYQIQDYQPPKELIEGIQDEEVIAPEDFAQLITYLKQQHDYLFEMEQSFQKYSTLVAHIEQFINVEYQETRLEGSFFDKQRPQIKIVSNYWD